MSRIHFIPYPPTSFPVRDLLVLERVAFGPADVVCEIGVGSGETAVRLAKMAGSVVGLEISEVAVAALRYLEDAHDNLRFFVADATEPAQIEPLAGKFTRVVACDTLEHVADARGFFAAIERLLAPDGEFFVTFPNEPPNTMHGITRFDGVEDLRAVVDAAGLVVCKMGAAQLAPGPKRVAEMFGWAPLDVVRKLLRRGSYRREDAIYKGWHGAGTSPQTFDETHFMKNLRVWKKVAPVVNLYWYVVLQAMDLSGPCYSIDDTFSEVPFADCQVVLHGKKPARAAGSSS